MSHLTITVSEIERDIGRKSSFFHIPVAFDAPVSGVPVGISPPRLHGWKDNSMFAKPLAACTYLSSIVSELYDA